MKKILSLILATGMLSGVATAAAPDVSQVAKMAQKDSDVSIEALCMAVYEAVKANPDAAVDVFKSVMMQRESWNATDTYAILRSVMLAAPALEDGFVKNAPAYNNNPGSYELAAVDSVGYQLLAALYTLPQTQPVAGAVAQAVLAGTVTGTSVGSGVSSDALEGFVPNAPNTTPEQDLYPVIPTPGPVSPNN